MMVLGQKKAVLGQYNLVLFGIKLYQISIGLLCLYMLNKRRFCRVSPQRDNDKQTNKERQSYSANGPKTAEMSNSEEFSKDISRLCTIPMREYPYFLFPFLIVNQVSLYKHIVFSNFRGGILLFNTFELEHFLKALQNKKQLSFSNACNDLFSSYIVYTSTILHI